MTGIVHYVYDKIDKNSKKYKFISSNVINKKVAPKGLNHLWPGFDKP